MTERGAALLHAVIELTVDMPDNVQDLEQGYAENRAAWDLLKADRPELWQRLVTRAAGRKAELRHGQHLTPASGARQDPAWLSLTINEQLRYLRGN
jgi:hypothetical protein